LALVADDLARQKCSIGFDAPGAKDLEALYRFDEGGANLVRDTPGVGEPSHLKIENSAAVCEDQPSLSVHGPTLIVASTPAKRLVDAVKKSQMAMFEAWVTTADPQQKGPARIFTLANGVVERNFTLG
jgi:hypothetical protein